ncbi:MAG: keto-deoxy-phosphogluconate aldolase [Gammaproteobacteria bacterium RIFCSPLOWO2_02_FULL_57_10]|nr:MAG: keto-deoxy-phosphogluconate aldolase [Gammaproteobacteria bacterium RIFCSPLOWO2_02_FULL_57_10]
MQVNERLSDYMRSARVLPVLTINTEAEALAVVKALAAGGLRAVEITLRTPAALAAIAAVKKARPDFIVAAGTVRTVADMRAVAAAGVDFAVSPGFTPALSACARELGLPFLPGVATPSEIIAGMECGHASFKFFPAEAAGGIPMLKALVSPFAGIAFCPTGGIGTHNFLDYLALPNVLCIGGSWMVDAALIKQERWSSIEQLSRDCVTELKRV